MSAVSWPVSDLHFPIRDDVVEVGVLQDVILPLRGGLEQGPALEGLEPDLVGQLLEHVLSRVLGMNVQGLGPAPEVIKLFGGLVTIWL